MWFQLPWLAELSLKWFGKNMMLATAAETTFSVKDLQHYQAAWGQPGATTSMINWYRAMGQRVLRRAEATGRVSVPMLMLWGMRDAALTFQTAQRSRDYADTIELITFEEATHWLQHDEADAVNEALINFFDAAAST